jgi:hypothetical protein
MAVAGNDGSRITDVGRKERLRYDRVLGALRRKIAVSR